MKYNTQLLFRGADLSTRVLVNFTSSDEDPERPYVIGFYNLALGDRPGDKPIELKHSDSGFIWIDGGHLVAHTTAAFHTFTIRNTDKEDVFSVTLQEDNEEL